MVIGSQEAVEVIRENDALILDGTSGLVFTNPPRSICTEYERLKREKEVPSEDNPYLGWRAIRMTLELDHVLRNQIRAILRSSIQGPVRLLVPMVSSVWEIKTILDIVQEEKRTLQCRGQDFDPNLPVGIMLEVPAAVFVLPNLLRYIDFVSKGNIDICSQTPTRLPRPSSHTTLD